jgi:hypothetical protein
LRSYWKDSKACDTQEEEITMKRYKVLTQKDRAFGGKFNPEKVEEALNSLGQEGWELKAVATAEFPSLTGGRQELVVILEKDI